MDLDKMQVVLNIAVVEYAINKLKECLASEADQDKKPGNRQVIRYQTVAALDYTIKFLRGDVVLTDEVSAKEALQLDFKYKDSIKKIMALTQKITELEEQLTHKEPEPTFVCAKCGREFATKRGLGKHAKACKG